VRDCRGGRAAASEIRRRARAFAVRPAVGDVDGIDRDRYVAALDKLPASYFALAE
jgi:hypothetical protein